MIIACVAAVLVLSKIEIDPRAFRDIALASLGFYAALTVVSWAAIRVSGLDRRAFLAPSSSATPAMSVCRSPCSPSASRGWPMRWSCSR
jgi:hypothetical protein